MWLHVIGARPPVCVYVTGAYAMFRMPPGNVTGFTVIGAHTKPPSARTKIVAPSRVAKAAFTALVPTSSVAIGGIPAQSPIWPSSTIAAQTSPTPAISTSKALQAPARNPRRRANTKPVMRTSTTKSTNAHVPSVGIGAGARITVTGGPPGWPFLVRSVDAPPTPSSSVNPSRTVPPPNFPAWTNVSTTSDPSVPLPNPTGHGGEKCGDEIGGLSTPPRQSCWTIATT